MFTSCISYALSTGSRVIENHIAFSITAKNQDPYVCRTTIQPKILQWLRCAYREIYFTYGCQGIKKIFFCLKILFAGFKEIYLCYIQHIARGASCSESRRFVSTQSGALVFDCSSPFRGLTK